MADEKDSEEELGDAEMPDESDVKEGEESSGTYPCPSCGKDVYEDAIRCPHCQQYVTPDAVSSGPLRWIALGVLAALAGLAAWLLLR